ncbi:hypothetical protein HZA56_11205, partial [Candidatus Poribacteria bacterium]|nr:hypothetical protein [Candidatus Poribacteria bacterium]
MKQFERLIAMLVLCASAFFLLIDESQAIEYDEFSNCSLDGWNETTAKWGGIVDSNWSDYLLVGTYVDQTFGRLYLNCYWRFPLTIPRDSTILSANIRFTPEVPVQGDGALVASFQALVPDGIWETSVAGLGSYFYPSATALRSIPLQGTPVEWWISGLQQYTLYDGPDIANLVQERIEDADYDPNGSTAKIGLALNYVSEDAYASIKPSTYNNCTTWWYPRLCVVWTPGNVNLDKAQPKEIDAFTNNARFTKEPVDVITGKMVTFPQVDFTLSGLNEPLEFIRNYSSQSEYDGVLGYGWTHNYNIILTSYDYDTTLVTIMDGEGKHHFFTDTDGDRTYAPTINDGTSVVKTFGSPDTYVWKTKDGKTYHFDEIHKTICTNPPSCSDNDYLHYLTAIEYKDGNQISFSYTINSGNITHSEIVDTHGRIVSLNYSNGRIVSIDEPGRHDAGQLIQFGYTNGNLTSVSQPVDANTTYTRYYYYNDPNDPHNMTRLQDQRGNSFYYAYDANDRCYLSYGDNVGGWPSFKTQLQYFPDDNQTVVTRFRDAEQFTDTYTYSGEYITQVDHALSGITEKYSYGLNPGGTSALTKLIVGPPDEWHTNGYYLKTISHYNANFDLIDTVEGTVGSESADPTSTPVRMY